MNHYRKTSKLQLIKEKFIEKSFSLKRKGACLLQYRLLKTIFANK